MKNTLFWIDSYLNPIYVLFELRIVAPSWVKPLQREDGIGIFI